MAPKRALGIDFGGTKLLAAVVDIDTGKVVASSKKRTSSADGPKEVLQRITDVADGALKEARLKPSQIEGIGVGIAGQVDPDSGVLLGTPNLSQSVVNLPIAKYLTERYKVPCALRNDVQIAAVGEQAFGAGRGYTSFLCVFVGTGVGGALVIDGRLQRGATGSAGEIGHLVVDAGGRLCGCGGHGHLEAYASRTAITASIIGDLKRGRPSILRKLVPDLENPGEDAAALRSGVLAQAVAASDELVTETIRQAGWYLGLGIASVVNLVNPQRVIMGGGVIEAVDLLFEVAAADALREALPAAGSQLQIVKAGLGDDAGVVGAALLGANAG